MRAKRRHQVKNKIPGWLKIGRILIFGAMTCAAVWMIAKYTVDIAAAFRAGGWPTSQGTVFFSSTQPCAKPDSYLPVVRYRYKVGEAVYGAQRVAFGHSGCGSKSQAEALAAKYKVDAAVTVYYNPENLGESVLLVDDVPGDTWLGIALSLLFFAGSVYLTAQSVRSMRSPPR
jgi:hypothetical protein